MYKSANLSFTEYQINPFAEGRNMRLVFCGLPGTPIFEVAEAIANFYDLDYFSIERYPEELNNYWIDKIPSIIFDTGDLNSGSASQQFDRDPAAAQTEQEMKAMTPPLTDNPLSPAEIQEFKKSKAAIIATEIAEVELIHWAKNTSSKWALIFIDADEEKAVKWFNLRRKCTTCQTTYHLKDKPSKFNDICDRCGSDLVQRSEDNPSVVRHQFNIWRNEFYDMIQEAKKHKHLIIIDIDQFQNIKDIIEFVDKQIIG